MAAILSAEHLSKSYTLKKLLTDVTIYVGEHDRIGVVGVNGTGKSTLLKLLSGLDEPDGGVVMRKNGLRVSYLPQMPDYSQPRTAVQQVLFDAPKDVGAPDEYEAKALLSQFGIDDFDADVRTLSGGQKKRVALAAALIRPVDLLMLDEPTNHIDAETIALLEGRLAKYRGALMMVTHDRYFLDRVCNRIAEISDGELYLHDGNFSYYLEQKAARLEMENAAARKRSSILRRELEWIRRGAQARSTKQKARIQRFEEMSAISGPQEEQRLSLGSTSARLGRRIIECEAVCKALGGRTLISDFTYTILRDERMAVVGPNGCGKTTLLRMLAGQLAPDSGTIAVGETVKIGFFTQEFPKVAPNVRLIDFMRDIAEYVETPDGRFSASQMLEQFLFPPDVQYTPVERLSGGEKRRLYLASLLMASPNVLLLDEPLGALDLKLRREMQLELKRIQRESGITFIFVTHDQEEALTMSDRVAVMSAGHILQLGTPEDIYNEPQSAFVADFIGDSDIMAGTMVRDKLVRFLGCDFPCVDTGFGENADVDVVLRPEDVKLKPADDPVQGVPQGVVESLLFKGVHYEMKVRVGDSVLLVHSTHARPVGTQVKLTVAPEDIQVMRKSDYSPDILKRHAARV